MILWQNVAIQLVLTTLGTTLGIFLVFGIIQVFDWLSGE